MAHIDALWAKVPVEILASKELSPTDKIVYGVIAAFAGGRSRWFGPVKEIAEAADCSIRSVESAVPKLVRLGYLRTKRQGMLRMTVNEYTILAQVRQLPDERSANNNGSLPQITTDAKTQKTDTEEEDPAARAEKWDAICNALQIASAVDHPNYWKKNKKVPEITSVLQRLLNEFGRYNKNLRLTPGSVSRLNMAAEILAPLDLNDASFTSSLNEAGGIDNPNFLQELAKVAVSWAEDVRSGCGRTDLG